MTAADCSILLKFGTLMHHASPEAMELAKSTFVLRFNYAVS